MPQYAVTRHQHDVLAFITARIRTDGVAPSFDEMAAHVGLASKSGIHRIVSALEERGQIVRLPGRARAIALPSATDRVPREVAATLGQIARHRNISPETALRRAVELYARSPT